MEQTYGDSDSDNSDLLNASIDNDDDSEESSEAEVEVKAAGSDYDSDKDPAWRPNHHRAAKQPKVSRITTDIGLWYFQMSSLPPPLYSVVYLQYKLGRFCEWAQVD